MISNIRIILLIVIGSIYLCNGFIFDPRIGGSRFSNRWTPNRWDSNSWWNPRPWNSNPWWNNPRPWNPNHWWNNPRPWGKRSTETGSESLECLFTESNSLLSCHSMDIKLECDVTSVFSGVKPSLLKIASQSVATEKQEIKYSLYPQRLDKSGWLDTKVTDSETKKISSYSLYHSQTITDFGFRFKRPVCWKAFLNIIQESSSKIDTISVLREDGKSEDVKVIGQISLLP